MELVISSRNMELSAELKKYIERKLGHFDRKLSNIMETRIEVYEEKTRSLQDRNVINVSISGADIVLHSQERGETVLSAVDKAYEAINKQIIHQKGKWQDQGKMPRPPVATETTTPASRRIVETRSLRVKPMSLEEALSQIEVLGYSYLLFQNSDTKTVNLLLRRADGNFDLILSEPE